jgi:hypothetical protein
MVTECHVIPRVGVNLQLHAPWHQIGFLNPYYAKKDQDASTETANKK